MAGPAAGNHTNFHPSPVAPLYVEVGRFTQQDKVRAQPFLFHQYLHGRALARFLLDHPHDVERAGLASARPLREKPSPVQHGSQGAFHVHRATPVQMTVHNLAPEGIVAPRVRVTHVHRVHMSVEEQNGWLA